MACDDIMSTGWTPAAASSTLEGYLPMSLVLKNFNVCGQDNFRKKNNNMTRGSQGFVGQSSPNLAHV